MRPVVAGLCLWLAAALCPAAAERPRVVMQTNLGSFVMIDALGAIPVQTGRDFIGDVPSRQIVLEEAHVLAPDTNY